MRNGFKRSCGLGGRAWILKDARVPNSHQSWVRRTDSTGLSTIEAGRPDGPAMLLLHGLTESADTWRPIAQPWLLERWVVAVDLRGHGQPPRFSDPDLAADPAQVMVNDVVRLAQELSSKRGPVDVVGHSLGGFLALAATLESPASVRRLVLEDPAPADGDWLPGTKEPFLREQIRMLDAFETGDPALRPPPGDRWSPQELRRWLDAKPLVDRGLITSGHVTSSGRLPEMVDALQAPTLILLADPSHLDEMLPAVTNPLGSVEVVTGAGHCIHRDEPAQFHRRPSTWFDRGF